MGFACEAAEAAVATPATAAGSSGGGGGGNGKGGQPEGLSAQDILEEAHSRTMHIQGILPYAAHEGHAPLHPLLNAWG